VPDQFTAASARARERSVAITATFLARADLFTNSLLEVREMARLHCFVCLIIGWFLLGSPLLGDGATRRDDRPPDPELERLYNAWLRFLEEPGPRLSSGSLQTRNPHFEAIVAKGSRAVPFLVGKLESSSRADISSFLMRALSRMTRVRPLSREEARGMSTTARAKAWVAWFKSLHENTALRLPEKAAAWRRLAEGTKPALWRETTFYNADLGELQSRKEATEAGRAYQAVLDLGVPVLPLLVERLRSGETCHVPIFEELTNSRASVHGPNAATTSRNCIRWWDRNKKDWIIRKP